MGAACAAANRTGAALLRLPLLRAMVEAYAVHPLVLTASSDIRRIQRGASGGGGSGGEELPDPRIYPGWARRTRGWARRACPRVFHFFGLMEVDTENGRLTEALCQRRIGFLPLKIKNDHLIKLFL